MKKQKVILVSLFVLAFVLRVWKLGSHSYNSAEIGVLGTGIKSILGLLPEYIRSPFFRLLLYGWIKLFSVNEFTTRLFSVLFGSLAIFPVYFLVKAITEKTSFYKVKVETQNFAPLIVAWFSAISPFYIIFSRVVTDFGISLFFISLSLLLFWLFCEKGKFLTGYIIVTILMLYSVALGFLTLIGEWVYFLLKWREYRARIKSWLIAQVSILVFYSYWLILFCQKFPLEWNALSKMPTTLLNKIDYTFFAFSLGETVLPWDWKIVFPAGIVFITIFIFGIRKMWDIETVPHIRSKRSVFSFVSILFVAYLIPLFTNRGAPDYCVGASIMYYTVLALGLTKLKKPLFITGLGLCSLFNGYSLYNLYTDRNYNMQSFTDDWRNVSAVVQKLSGEPVSDGDTKVVSFHTSFNWYYKAPNLVPLNWKRPLDTIKEIEKTPKIIYVEAFGSGGASSDDRDIYDFKKWLEQNYTLTQTIGLCENENCEIRRKFLKRIFPGFRIQVFVYELKGLPEPDTFTALR